MPKQQEYSHRNGEKEAPTEAGFYWQTCNQGFRVVEVTVLHRPGKITTFFTAPGFDEQEVGWLNIYPIRWWGPLPSPVMEDQVDE